MKQPFSEKLTLLRSSVIEKTNMTQRIAFFGVVGTLMLSVVGGLVYKSYASSKNDTKQSDETPRKEKRIKIESGGSILSSQEIWVDRLEKEQALLNKRFSTMEKILTELANGKLASGQQPSLQTGHESNSFSESMSADSSLSPNVLDLV
ncbi:MAG: hypothetical protein NWQ29_03985, partial [Alphaproteobacteria bacterium]|nr:hypothetical protein [Alphaproteobacteria bacterium]